MINMHVITATYTGSVLTNAQIIIGFTGKFHFVSSVEKKR